MSGALSRLVPMPRTSTKRTKQLGCRICGHVTWHEVPTIRTASGCVTVLRDEGRCLQHVEYRDGTIERLAGPVFS